MAISLKHEKVSTIADDAAASAAGKVLPSHWNAEHTLTQATARILGRLTAATGATEELTAAQVFGLIDQNLTRRTADASPVTISATTDDIVIVDLTVEAAVNVTFPTVAARVAAGLGRIGLKNGHSNPALYPVTPVRSGSDTIDGTATPLDQDHGRVTWYVPIAATNDWEIHGS